jgi:hypothetical protein
VGAKGEPTEQEILYNQPLVDGSRARITGPFTVEAVPAPVVKPLVEINSDQPADDSIARSGETLRQAEWREESKPESDRHTWQGLSAIAIGTGAIEETASLPNPVFSSADNASWRRKL